jgi:hypothetical protein
MYVLIAIVHRATVTIELKKSLLGRRKNMNATTTTDFSRLISSAKNSRLKIVELKNEH